MKHGPPPHQRTTTHLMRLHCNVLCNTASCFNQEYSCYSQFRPRIVHRVLTDPSSLGPNRTTAHSPRCPLVIISIPGVWLSRCFFPPLYRTMASSLEEKRRVVCLKVAKYTVCIASPPFSRLHSFDARRIHDLRTYFTIADCKTLDKWSALSTWILNHLIVACMGLRLDVVFIALHSAVRHPTLGTPQMGSITRSLDMLEPPASLMIGLMSPCTILGSFSDHRIWCMDNQR